MAAGHVNAPHYVPDITVQVDPLAFLGPWIYPPLLGEAEQALYHHRRPAIRTCLREHAIPRVSIHNFRIRPTDVGAASGRHLETVHLCQAHGYKLNASVGAIMAHKVSGRRRHFPASANNYSLLTSPTHITGLEDLRAFQDLADAHGWNNHEASLMPDDVAGSDDDYVDA